MNDKRDLSLSIINMIEWCARHGNFTTDYEDANWELYLGDRIIAYNYDADNAFITKYTATGCFPYGFRIEVKMDHQKGLYKLIKRYV